MLAVAGVVVDSSCHAAGRAATPHVCGVARMTCMHACMNIAVPDGLFVYVYSHQQIHAACVSRERENRRAYLVGKKI